MNNQDAVYQACMEILRRELIPATGCTEPIALAYCAAKARSVLGCLPDRVDIEVSGNIIKNVKSVTVPNTGGLKGIPAAAAAGIVAGREEAALQVLSQVTEEQEYAIAAFLSAVPIRVTPMQNCDLLDIRVTVGKGENSASVRINHAHDHIDSVILNGRELASDHQAAVRDEAEALYDLLTVQNIFDFANAVDPEEVRPILDRQIECNTAIAREGMENRWGAGVGSILMDTGDGSARLRAMAMAAAGSDARMSGCEMPVVINSGSGNQGLTVSLPVIEYYRDSGLPQEMLYRALVISNLCSIHAKHAIGKLSAYCGAVTAGSAAAAGVAYLKTRSFDAIAHTIVNSLAITSGIICDGAKPSCAGKIASAISAGLLGMEMYEHGSQFYGGDGIIAKGIENTLRNVGRLGAEGMRGTDETILDIMTRESR